MVFLLPTFRLHLRPTRDRVLSQVVLLPLLLQYHPACLVAHASKTSNVNSALECPNCSDAALGETPMVSSSVAAVCRRS